MRTHPKLSRLACVVLAAAGLGLALPVAADPFAGADLAAGEKMHDELCIACHVERFGGENGSAIYTRPDRRVSTASALTQQLTVCTTQLDLPLFPEDERHIAAYLNKHFYKFK